MVNPIVIEYVNNIFTAQFFFEKTNMSLRECIYSHFEDFKNSNTYDLVLPVSGGNDSILASKCFDDLGIPAKRIHQRYYANGELLNYEENRNLDTNNIQIDVYQDLDIEEYQKSDFFTENFKFFDRPLHYCLYEKMIDLYNPEKERLVFSAPIMNFMKFTENSPAQFISSLTIGPGVRYLTSKNPVLKNLFFAFDNAKIFYSMVMDPLYMDQIENMKKGIWEREYKHILFKKHFPEINFIRKPVQHSWNYFRSLIVDEKNSIYRIGDTKIDFWLERRHLRCDYKTFYKAVQETGVVKMQKKIQKSDPNLWYDYYEGNDYVR